ncbi:MAG: DNA polymerase III subunit gamma/tau [Betaproteobacteria bacterium]|nr:DNA polymerase III subunit gamma/tau [Betaproteobacteria bacterium]
MSYQVLARKWRPKDFGSLVGQEHVVRALRHALDEKRLHHAYLFTGTRGVGKTTLARILAKCLNCEKGISSQPCGKCSACVEIDGGRFVDLLEVDAATNTKVDEMRQLLETAQYAPSRGRFKVYVIDEVHMLSTSAFNAMLKTLEEPPEHLKFILATTDPQKIPVTVLSRCLQFNLKQMPQAAMVAHLARILDAEGIKHDAEALALVARGASGSMRDALSLLDQAIAHGGGAVYAPGVAEMLGAIDQEYLLRLVEALANGQASAALAVATEMRERSLSFDFALVELAGLFLRIALVQAVPEAVGDDVPARARVEALATEFTPESVQLCYQIAVQGRQDLPLAPDEYSGFVMTILRMHAFRPEGSAEPAAPPSKPTSAPPKSRANSSAPGALPAATASREWPEIVEQLQVTGAARELARNAELRSREGQIFDLVVPRAKAYLAERAYQEKLKAALEQLVGAPVTVKVTVGEVTGASAAAMEADERDARQTAAARAVRSDGFVQDLVNLFDGKIVESTIRQTEK